MGPDQPPPPHPGFAGPPGPPSGAPWSGAWPEAARSATPGTAPQYPGEAHPGVAGPWQSPPAGPPGSWPQAPGPGGPPGPVPPLPYQVAPGYPVGPGYPAGPGSAPRPAPGPTDGFAVAGFILGLIGGLVLSVIFSIVALRRIGRTGARGRGLAVAGLVLSGLWVLVIAGLVGFGALTAAQRDESGTVTRSGLVSPGDLQVGDCLRSAPKEGVATRGTVVPCDQAHTAQVFHIADLPKQATYPDERTLARQAEDLCHQGQKNLNLGELPDDGEVMYFYPVESSWPIERSVQCVLTTDAPLTRSLVRAGAAG